MGFIELYAENPLVAVSILFALSVLARLAVIIDERWTLKKGVRKDETQQALFTARLVDVFLIIGTSVWIGHLAHFGMINIVLVPLIIATSIGIFVFDLTRKLRWG